MSFRFPSTRLPAWAALALLLAAPAPITRAQPTHLWSQGDPTAEEQSALEWLNLARADPVGTLTYLYSLDTSDAVIEAFVHYKAGSPGSYASWTSQNLKSLRDSYAYYQSQSITSPKSYAVSTAPFALYPAFTQQARVYSDIHQPLADLPSVDPRYTIPTYIFPVPIGFSPGSSPEYTGPNATGGTAKFGLFGGNYYNIAQSHLYNPLITGREWILSALASDVLFFINQGDPLPTPGFSHNRMAGIAITGSTDQDRLIDFYFAGNEFLTSSDLPFGILNTVFITGVAYRDSNSNAHYDIGEGLAGATIIPDRGDWYAVTSTSGGYSIPVNANSGTYTLTVTTGPLKGATATATVGSENVKLDWTLPPLAAVLPTQATTPPPSGQTQFLALSTRGLVENGSNSLIGGLVIGGGPAVQKKLLVRGVGLSLSTIGVTGFIGYTQLQIYNSSGTVVASNTGWLNAPDGGTAAAQAAATVGDFPLLRTDFGGADSAVVLILGPGAYTVVVSPRFPADFDATGYIGLLEVYDLNPANGYLQDIATRGHVGTGNQQLIVGCVIAGTGTKRILVRGIGPQLQASFQIPNTLQDPQIALYSGSQQVAYNDNWSISSQTNQLRALAPATGAAPLLEGSVDAALLATVAPGNYTAIVSAKPNTTFTGVALVELYDAP